MKIPRLDGLTIEFYIGFYDMIGADMLRVVEESRLARHVHGLINSTFIALIPKKDLPTDFDDFRSISICNCLYEIIAKVISMRFKVILSRCISSEQFGFLEGRQIHEAIGVA